MNAVVAIGLLLNQLRTLPVSDTPSIIPRETIASESSQRPTPAEALALLTIFINVRDPHSRQDIMEYVKKVGLGQVDP